jgi:signal transduction histidine kinase/ActR/RegA family two-component response regulator
MQEKITTEANILVIDDEAVIRDGCIKILSKEGWKVETAENGHDGIEMVNNKNFDILLLDLMMPGMSGMEVIQEIKCRTPSLYVIVITGYATIETAVEAMKMGAYDYIPKPFTPDQLRIVVRKVLATKALIREAEYLRMEQEKGLHAIAQEKSRIMTIMNCMPNGVLVIDQDKRIALYNPIARKLLNIAGNDPIGKEVDECIDCKDLSDMISETLKGRCDNITGIVSEIAGNNAIPIMAHVAPVVMADRGIAGVVTILQDITHQKAVEKMKSDFIAKVTHELKSPVATITQQLSTLLEGALGELSEEQKKMIEKAKLWSLGLISLISDLLTICKIESGLTMQKRTWLDIRDVVLDAVDLLKPQADDKKITINLSLKQLPKIHADREDMKEVFANLIINAIKYNNEGGTLDICGEADNHNIRVSVSDNGFGIKQEDLKLIFDRFFRVKNNITRFITGTGLGLPIVKEIVESHNGSIEVLSEEGKGSRFTVSLPICPD